MARTKQRAEQTSADPKDAYLARFERTAAAQRGPRWLADRRAAAMDRFREAGFPTTKHEGWRFTNVAPVTGTAFTDPAVQSVDAAPRNGHAVFVNGVFQPKLSSLAGLPAGVQVGSLAARLGSDGDLLEAHLARYARHENPFAALSTAFFQDGAFVYLPRGVAVSSPLHLVFLSVPGSEPVLTYPRTLIVADREASGAVVEWYEAAGGGGPYLTNAVTEVIVGDGAHLDHCRIQRETERAYHMATTQSHQSRDSTFRSCTVALGSSLSRHDINAVLDGPGAHLTLNGLSFLGGRQHVDHHTTLEHAQPNGESRELFNGVFGDQSRGVFNGRIIVRPGAQRTDSKQTNNNVLLSEDARADSQPQLEIYADDVKCTHGATLGPLDHNAVFYLQSRGLGEADARRLLTYGFSAEVLAQIPVTEVREQLDRLVRARLALT